jgi:adenylate cyclase
MTTAARLAPVVQRKRKRPGTKTLLAVSNRVAVAKSLGEALDTVVHIATSLIGAETGSIFLNDPTTGELYTRIAKDKFSHEIRMTNTVGIAGEVFTTGKSLIIDDAYADTRFNRAVDSQTGFTTNNILCIPLFNLTGEKIGVAELLNKKVGKFSEDDLSVLDAIVRQAAIFFESHRVVETMERARQQELQFVNFVSEMSSELKLAPLLQKLITAISQMLNAERSTLFINDEKTNELYTVIGEGLGSTQIRFPNNVGIAGTVFTSRRTINIPYAYADLRFNPSFDRRTGFFTRSILCIPVITKEGKTIGVTQVLNKRGGAFTDDDEARLRAFTSQISIGLENAKLFDEVQTIKNYNEGILESMSSALVTLNEDGVIVTCNSAGFRIMKTKAADILQKSAKEFFGETNGWILDRIKKVEETQTHDIIMGAQVTFGGEAMSVNLTIQPLRDAHEKKLGWMMLIEDITNEKRLKSTMSRYMDASLTEKLLQKGEDILGGASSTATVLFSDIRSFTTVTEELGAHATVSLLNEYFTLMVDCIQNHGGMLDKFIGDAIMAVFGVPIAHDDDEDRAVRTAMEMLKALNAYNALRISEGKKPINVGIGVNTDTIVSGNIGSPKRMDYTVIGDGVNLASRLESACKQYGTTILISEATFRKLRGTYRAREIDRVVVKGKTEPISVYEILDYHTPESFPNIVEVLSHFRDGLMWYREGKWEKAKAAFGRSLAANPNDVTSKVYLDRCEFLRTHPPDDWHGVWKLNAK